MFLNGLIIVPKPQVDDIWHNFLQFPSSCSSWWWHENVNECKLELLQGGCSQGEPGHALKDPESHLKYLLDAPVISVILVIIILRSNYPCLVCINIRYTVSTVSWYIAFCTPPPCLFTVPSLIVWRVTDFWFYADPSLIPSNLIMISCGCDNAAILGTKCQIRVSQGILTLPPHILTLQGRSVWNMYPNYIHWIELNWIEYPTPRNALFVRWSVTFFTPSNTNAHEFNIWVCALDF